MLSLLNFLDMKRIIESFKLTPFYEIVLPIISKVELYKWHRRSKIFPTPKQVKYEMIRNLGKKYSIKTLVETGTYLGTMVSENKNSFDKIYTVELDTRLYRRAKKKFSRFKHIEVRKGDSAKALNSILKKIKHPTLFWLDAHYSGGITAKGEQDTPILFELNQILKSNLKNYVILIDDADKFNGKNDYPSIKKLKNLLSRRNNYHILIENNIIKILPNMNKRE